MKDRPWKLSSLTRVLSELEPFPEQDPTLEQVATPPEWGARLLWDAHARGDITGKSVLDIGCGTGILAIGAALLGAGSVTGIDGDERALKVAKSNAQRTQVSVDWKLGRIPETPIEPAETIVMNPPFGVQKHGAIVPFLQVAVSALKKGGGMYFFAGPGSQRLIERNVLPHSIRLEEHSRSTWRFPPVFAFHTERAAELQVDRWILRKNEQ